MSRSQTSSSSSLGILPQSRLLSSRTVDPLWLESLFRFIEEKPRTAVYSMAFMFSFVRTYGISTNDLGNENARVVRDTVAAFVGGRELFDLLDDNLGNTDTLTAVELQRARVFGATHFARSNDSYVALFDERIVPILKRYRTLFGDYGAVVVDTAAVVATFARNFRRDEDTRELTVNHVLSDVKEIRSVLTRVNACAEAAHGMRIPVNPRCSRSVLSIDVSSLDGLVDRLESDVSHGSDDHLSWDQILHAVAETLSRPIVIDSVSQQQRGVVTPFDRPYTYLEAYAAYAPVVYRYESLNEISTLWRNYRLARRRDDTEEASRHSVNNDDEFVRCIVLPSRGVWQSGTSQILWIVLHVLAALTVERRNRYIERMLVLLENLSFFVWCGACSVHWASNRGDEFFRHVSTLPLSSLRKLPIDIVLLRCHNTVYANSGNGGQRGRTLSSWNLANLCLDYRDFASKALLRRGDRSTAREFRIAVCRPLANAFAKIRRNEGNGVTDGNGNDDIVTGEGRTLTDDRLLTLALTTTDHSGTRPFTDGHRSTVETSTRDTVLLNALKNHYGEQLMRRLWNDIDPTMNVPICAMW